MQERFKISVRRSCRLAKLRASVWYAKSRAADQSALRQRIRDIAKNRPRFGYLRVLVMLKREGWAVGKKRVYRLYRLEGLQLRMKVTRRKRIALLRGKVPKPTAANQHWSMDFVHDQTHDGLKFRILTVIDQWSRESVSLEANFRPTRRCVGHALDAAAATRGLPKSITVDNEPTDNGLIESFNGRLRDEFLNVNEFITMHDVREKLKAWQIDYNDCRPHGSLGNLTPSEYAKMTSGRQPEAAKL
jgi:putative transposase